MWILWFFVIALAVGLFVWFLSSPAPSAFVIRIVFDKEARAKKRAMAKTIGSLPVNVIRDIRYGVGKRSKLDVYIPESAYVENKRLPAIIWTHGGAWISGDKTDPEPYFKLLASRGFVVVSPNYDLAPRRKYPSQIHQLNRAHRYVLDNAKNFNIDTASIFLAGDSAGAQISVQLAALATNPAYAKEMRIAPELTERQLRGVVAYCGIYDMNKLAAAEGVSSRIVRWGFGVVTWAYSGGRGPHSSALRQASPIHYVTGKFPASFISGGNNDSLTKTQSLPFSNKLSEAGVKTITRYDSSEPGSNQAHECQFVLDSDGLDSFRTMISFLEQISLT